MQPKLNEYSHSFLLAETFDTYACTQCCSFPKVRLLFGMRLFNLSTLRVNDGGLQCGSYFWVCRQNSSVWHSNATSLPILSHRTIFLVGISHFWVGWWINSAMWPFKWNLSSSTFTSCCFFGFLQNKVWHYV